MSKPTLYLMLGYPGAGKTTAAEAIARLTGAVHLSSDAFHVAVFPEQTFSKEEHTLRYRTLDYVTELLLRSGVSVIYDANMNRYIHRLEKYRICEKYGVKPKLIWVKAPEPTARVRATVEGEDDPKRPYGNLDETTFNRLVRNIQPPRGDEPCIEIDGTKITDDYVAAQLGLTG
jgi:predicted kinase